MFRQPDEVDDAPHNRAVERGLDLLDRKVVPVDRPAIAGPLDCGVVVLAGQQPDVVDLRNARANSWIARAATYRSSSQASAE